MSKFLILFFFASLESLLAQSEAVLRQAFEGKTVRVKMDMPATNQGVDLEYRGNPAVNFQSYSHRIKTFGVALRAGDTVMVTTVKVKGSNIEFQLGGGGYGTFGDDTGTVSLGTVFKSSRENDLERDLKNERDPRRRDQMNAELNRLRRDRERENSFRRSREKELEMVKKQEIAVKRLQGGSRFNLRFPPNYLKESIPTPEQVREALADQVDFDGAPRRAETPRGYIDPGPPPAAVRKGMSKDEVYGILSEPSSTRVDRVGDFEQLLATWLQRDYVTEVTFMNGVAVKVNVSRR